MISLVQMKIHFIFAGNMSDIIQSILIRWQSKPLKCERTIFELVCPRNDFESESDSKAHHLHIFVPVWIVFYLVVCLNIEFISICKSLKSFDLLLADAHAFTKVKDTKYTFILQFSRWFPIEFEFVAVLIATISFHA